MRDPIDPARLLSQAEDLAGVDAGPGRPNTTDHRRAVSAAYYALFHELVLASARHVLPKGVPDQEVWGITRWINHRDVRAVCQAVIACAGSREKPLALAGLPKGLSRSAEPIWRALSVPQANGTRIANVSSHLHVVAAFFVALHDARQSADYDHSATFSKRIALEHVQEASLAAEWLRERADSDEFQRFFAWIIARASGFKQ